MMKNFFFLCVIICAVELVGGCYSKKSDPGGTSALGSKHTPADGTDQKAEHAHGEGPHGGTVSHWGAGKFHVEFTVNHEKQEATVYILKEDAKTLFPIDASEITLAIKDPEFQVALKASPHEGEPSGKSSRFVGNHENLGIVKEYEGSITGDVDGKSYSGNFKEVPHDH
jgi:hypothetical protein